MRDERSEFLTPDREEAIMEALAESNAFDNRFDDASLERAFGSFMLLRTKGLSNDSFLQAHRVLLADSEDAAGIVIGAFRDKPALVGLNRLAPPAELIPEYVELAFEQAENRGSEQTADFLTKLHPFEKGSGRMARIVMYVMQNLTEGEIIPYDLSRLRKIANVYDSWVSENYLSVKSAGTEDAYWRRILDAELTS